MCACDEDPRYVCPRCAGTRHDHRYFLEPGDRELEQEAHARLISTPDFQKPFEGAR